MQMSLVMSMRYIFGDAWNDACKFGNDVIFLEWMPLIFVWLCMHDMQALIKKWHIPKYDEKIL